MGPPRFRSPRNRTHSAICHWYASSRVLDHRPQLPRPGSGEPAAGRRPGGVHVRPLRAAAAASPAAHSASSGARSRADPPRSGRTTRWRRLRVNASASARAASGPRQPPAAGAPALVCVETRAPISASSGSAGLSPPGRPHNGQQRGQAAPTHAAAIPLTSSLVIRSSSAELGATGGTGYAVVFPLLSPVMSARSGSRR